MADKKESAHTGGDPHPLDKRDHDDKKDEKTQEKENKGDAQRLTEHAQHQERVTDREHGKAGQANVGNEPTHQGGPAVQTLPPVPNPGAPEVHQERMTEGKPSGDPESKHVKPRKDV
jgi:hypothetical protein